MHLVSYVDSLEPLSVTAVGDRSHIEAWAGCMVSLTTPTTSPLKVSRSVSSRNLVERVSNAFLASYLRR